MGDKHIEFLKAALVEQQFDTFTRRQLAAPVLGVDPLLSAAKARRLATVFKLGQDVFHSRSPYFVARVIIRHPQRPKRISANLQTLCQCIAAK